MFNAWAKDNKVPTFGYDANSDAVAAIAEGYGGTISQHADVQAYLTLRVLRNALAGSNPCPPIVLGVGVGGSFDKVAYLAKKALLRPLDVPNPDPYYADLEKELLTAINELGIGPQGFGGRTTCLGLAIEQMPTHVAGLPVAVNVSCHVTRRASAAL